MGVGGSGFGVLCVREFKLSWREAGPSNHHDDKVDSAEEDVVINSRRASLRVSSSGVGEARGLPMPAVSVWCVCVRGRDCEREIVFVCEREIACV